MLNHNLENRNSVKEKKPQLLSVLPYFVFLPPTSDLVFLCQRLVMVWIAHLALHVQNSKKCKKTPTQTPPPQTTPKWHLKQVMRGNKMRQQELAKASSSALCWVSLGVVGVLFCFVFSETQRKLKDQQKSWSLITAVSQIQLEFQPCI